MITSPARAPWQMYQDGSSDEEEEAREPEKRHPPAAGEGDAVANSGKSKKTKVLRKRRPYQVKRDEEMEAAALLVRELVVPSMIPGAVLPLGGDTSNAQAPPCVHELLLAFFKTSSSSTKFGGDISAASEYVARLSDPTIVTPRSLRPRTSLPAQEFAPGVT